MTVLKKKRLRQLALWTALWTASILVIKKGHQDLWNKNMTITMLAIGINIILGILMIWVNRKLILESDELERKIQLEAMGITLGFTLIAGLAYSLLSLTEVIHSKAEISTLIMFMGITYLVCLLYNTSKYR